MKWIVIIIILIFNTITIFMRKRIRISEIYTTVTFALLIDVIADTYASARFKAWEFFSVEKIELSALLIIFGIYPAIAAIIINWYPYQSLWWKKFFCLIGWAIFSTAYE
ncbi:MAG: CBO0543 family protein [Bacillota bacterium]|nr:CBO0543 family protein [Bacillota bacterium]